MLTHAFTARRLCLRRLQRIAIITLASAIGILADPLVRSPLVLHWNNIDHNYTTPAPVNGYERIRVEGFVSKNAWPGAVPLKQYYSSTRHDSWLLADPASEAAAQATGYRFIRNDGYIFQQPVPGTVPLKTYWHSGRGDHATVAESRSETDQKNSGYSFVRVEGYVFPANDPDFGAHTLQVPVFRTSGKADGTRTAHKTSFVVHPDTAGSGCRYSWIGTLDGGHPHDVVITICDTGVTGRVREGFGIVLVDPFRISSQTVFGNRTPPVSPTPAQGPTIDIAIGYTSGVFDENTNMLNSMAISSPWPAMTPLAFTKARLQLAVDHANAVLGASGIPARLQLTNTKMFSNISEQSFIDAPVRAPISRVSG